MKVAPVRTSGLMPAAHSVPTRARLAQPASMVAAGGPMQRLQDAADASHSARQLKQLQALADAGVPQLAAMEEEEPLQGMGMEEEEPLQGMGMEEEEPLQGMSMEEEEPLQGMGMEEEEPLQGRFASRGAPLQREQAPATNRTGMPDTLKSGIESLSGMDMSGVRVHRNSAEPAKVGAHAFAQGTDIHLASGQDRHLPHEAWHVVQQAQGRVQPTRQAKGVSINDDAGLEREADVMGAKAMQQQAESGQDNGPA